MNYHTIFSLINEQLVYYAYSCNGFNQDRDNVAAKASP